VACVLLLSPFAAADERPEKAGKAGKTAPAPDLYESRVAPFVARHCLSCHDESKKKGDFVLGPYAGVEAAVKDRASWRKVAEKLHAGEMPPKGKPRPSAEDTAEILRWIEQTVLPSKSPGKRDPGRVTIRRLNNYEYNYTIRDLIGLDLKLADDFPSDEVGYGFDNIGDVLSIPPLLLERYLAAAEKIVDQAIVVPAPTSAARSTKPKEPTPKKAKGSRKEKEEAAPALPESHRRILFVMPKTKADRRDCARQILERFAGRAYRRPVVPDEVTRLLKLFDLAEKNNDPFERGIQIACAAVLSSPHFLFRVELDAKPRDDSDIHPVNEHELASRLSYFLWSSLPDAELSDLASRGELHKDDVLEKQVMRMLRDGKSRGLVKTFAALWLGSRAMKLPSPDTSLFPAFDEELRSAMRRETELFFEEVMKKDLSVLLFLDSDFTFLNEKLARHYGIAGVKGDEMQRVSLSQPELAGGRRGGVLTQGTFLTINSNPTRTSPVKRGKWILEQILGSPTPPPPPGNDNLKEGKSGAGGETLRQRTEAHRSDPACAGCHSRMDPLGFALENYDAVGAWREKDAKLPIDASASLPDGTSFRGIEGLKRALLDRKRDFCHCLAEKMLTFALGRGLESSDEEAVDAVTRQVVQSDYRFSSLVLAIVRSEPFQMRRGEKVTP
jgi:hypothetical protein